LYLLALNVLATSPLMSTKAELLGKLRALDG